ncbi:MAG: hypothetical protein IH598_01420 [Bacteroidales bacterium]|nr:hypothetical protein [Bacteroidales bacterium]
MIRSFTFLLTAALMGLVLVFSCATQKNDKKSETVKQEIKPSGVPSPPAIVYKTKEDYHQLVPVILSADKKKIVSFPAQSDIRINEKFPYPDPLENGYLLDNRGINQHAAFLKFSYEDYYNMDNIPTAERLMNYILDDDPFIEMYEVGRRSQFKNLIEEINQMIKEGKLSEMKNLLDD